METNSGRPVIFYVLTKQKKPGFWNISVPKRFEIISYKIKNSTTEWFLLLLEGSTEEGYLLTEQEVSNGIPGWTPVGDTWKLHVHDIPHNFQFYTFNMLFQKLKI